LGIILYGINACYRRDWLTLALNWVPMVLFFECIFGYMAFLIFYKWFAVLDNPPFLLPIMINMFLSPGKDLVEAGDQLFPGQSTLQQVLLAVALISVPVMLLPKPFILKAQAKKKGLIKPKDKKTDVEMKKGGKNSQMEVESSVEEPEPEPEPSSSSSDVPLEKTPKKGNGKNSKKGAATAPVKKPVPKKSAKKAKELTESEEEEEESKEEEEDGHEYFEFSEVFIHQVIHTIEFTLGSVSNTASYLRLWALSLAHSELATVFYDKIFLQLMQIGVDSTAQKPLPYLFILMFIAFEGWAAATIAVICVMESLSAFLHGLRLHWVEFQNKFYGGDGRRFLPFSFAHMLWLGQIPDESLDKQ